MSCVPKKLSRDTPYRQLSPAAYSKLVNMLQQGEAWRQLAGVIKDRAGNTKFTHDDVMALYARSRAQGELVSRALLVTWGYDNTSLDTLINTLTSVHLYRAADYLAVEILKDSAVPRDCNAENPTIIYQRNLSSQDCDASHPTSQTTPKQTCSDNATCGSGSISDTFPKQVDSLLSDTTPKQVDTLGDSISKDKSKVVQDNRKDGTSLETSVSRNPTVVVGLLSEGNLEVPYSKLAKVTGDFDKAPIHNGGHHIGQGGFGEVFLGELGGVRVAVKRLLENDFTQRQFLAEMNTMTKCCHRNILPLVGISQDGPHYCLVSPYMCNGSLEHRLSQKDGCVALTASQRVTVVRGTAEGLCYLHNQNIIHRDVKSANILLDADLEGKLADFGVARAGPSTPGNTSTQTSVLFHTPVYAAPEVHNGKISFKMDSFSYGVVLLEVLTGLPPFDENREERDLPSHVEEVDDITEVLDVRAGPWPDNLPDSINDTAAKCLKSKHKARPSMTELLEEITLWGSSC